MIKDLSYEDILKEIEFFSKSNNLNQKELNSIIIMKSVLNSSNEHWKNDPSNSRPRPGSKSIIADMGGALML